MKFLECDKAPQLYTRKHKPFKQTEDDSDSEPDEDRSDATAAVDLSFLISHVSVPGGLSVGEKTNIAENSGSESEDEVLCSHNTSAFAAEKNIVVRVTDNLEKIACMCPNNKNWNCGANNAVLNTNSPKRIICVVWKIALILCSFRVMICSYLHAKSISTL